MQAEGCDSGAADLMFWGQEGNPAALPTMVEMKKRYGKPEDARRSRLPGLAATSMWHRFIRRLWREGVSGAASLEGVHSLMGRYYEKVHEITVVPTLHWVPRKGQQGRRVRAWRRLRLLLLHLCARPKGSNGDHGPEVRCESLGCGGGRWSSCCLQPRCAGSLRHVPRPVLVHRDSVQVGHEQNRRLSSLRPSGVGWATRRRQSLRTS